MTDRERVAILRHFVIELYGFAALSYKDEAIDPEWLAEECRDALSQTAIGEEPRRRDAYRRW